MSRLNTRMRRWGVVLRIASRDARQSFGRTLTAVILISLPIIVAIGSITFWDVTTSQRYQASSWLGHTSDVQAVTLRRSSTALDQDITADVLSKTASDDEIDVTMETLTSWVPDGDHLIAVDTLYQLHVTAPDGTGSRLTRALKQHLWTPPESRRADNTAASPPTMPSSPTTSRAPSACRLGTPSA